MKYYHQPVLLEEILYYLNPQPNQNFIDCTIGGGGHAQAILEKSAPNGLLLGLDRDPAAIAAAKNNLKNYQNRLILIQDSYKNLPAILACLQSSCQSKMFMKVAQDVCDSTRTKARPAGINKIIYDQKRFLHCRGILLDLGLSSYQVSAEEQRGFSFKTDTALDMRFGPDSDLTAFEIVNNYPERKLAEIFRSYGEETRAKQIAKNIALFRNKAPIRTTFELMGTINSAIRGRPGGPRTSMVRGGLHPATKIFQALRIAVNNELDVLVEALPKLVEALEPGGRLAVISYHSLEDRIAKQLFKKESAGCLCPPQQPICTCQHQPIIKIINKKVITPGLAEVRKNPRSRSAKLRVAEKL
jgi:16S rRNA (cytosine1402-N4)-methyltransferase